MSDTALHSINTVGPYVTIICIQLPSPFSPYYIERRPPPADRKVSPQICRERSAYSSTGNPANATPLRRVATTHACVQTGQLPRAVVNAASGAWVGRNIQEDSNSIINSTASPPSRNGRGGPARAHVVTIPSRRWFSFELRNRTST